MTGVRSARTEANGDFHASVARPHDSSRSRCNRQWNLGLATRSHLLQCSCTTRCQDSRCEVILRIMHHDHRQHQIQHGSAKLPSLESWDRDGNIGWGEPGCSCRALRTLGTTCTAFKHSKTVCSVWLSSGSWMTARAQPCGYEGQQPGIEGGGRRAIGCLQ